jgi:hypothetical protein
MTKQDALDGIQKAKDERVLRNKEILKTYGHSKGFTQKQWDMVEIKVKGASGKGRNHSHTNLWNHYNEPVSEIKFDW